MSETAAVCVCLCVLNISFRSNFFVSNKEERTNIEHRRSAEKSTDARRSILQVPHYRTDLRLAQFLPFG